MTLFVNIFHFCWHFLVCLFAVQLSWQLVIAGIKHFYLWRLRAPATSSNIAADDDDGSGEQQDARAPMGVPYIRAMGRLLGLTGDNSPKKRIIAHDLPRSFALFPVAFLGSFWWTEWLPTHSTMLSAVSAVVLALLLTVAVYYSNVFLLLKLYSESGFGLNLYWAGWRIVGLDWHGWQIRQDPTTKKPLGRDQQYWCWPRPHVDVPPWNIHHWPFEDFEDAATLKTKMAETAASKAEKLARRAGKRQRREAKLQQKQTADADNGGDDGDGDAGLASLMSS